MASPSANPGAHASSAYALLKPWRRRYRSASANAETKPPKNERPPLLIANLRKDRATAVHIAFGWASAAVAGIILLGGAATLFADPSWISNATITLFLVWVTGAGIVGTASPF